MKIIETPIFGAKFHILHGNDVNRAIKTKTIEEAFKIAQEFCKQKKATLISISEFKKSNMILESSTKSITIDVEEF